MYGMSSWQMQAVADGYYTYLNLNDMRIFCVGPGPSATTGAITNSGGSLNLNAGVNAVYFGVAGTAGFYMNATEFAPQTSGTRNLGNGSDYFGTAYIQNVNASSTSGNVLYAGGVGLGTTAGNTTNNLLQLYCNNGNNSYLNIYGYRNANGTDWNTASTRIRQVIDVTNQAYIDFNPVNSLMSLSQFINDIEHHEKELMISEMDLLVMDPRMPNSIQGSLVISGVMKNTQAKEKGGKKQ
jgi:hypothetical protein